MEPEYKSAPIPDDPTDGGVTVVVGKNFDSIVKDKTKDVLLEVSTNQVVLYGVLCRLQVMHRKPCPQMVVTAFY